jgi:uncharacterized membrane protein YfcA
MLSSTAFSIAVGLVLGFLTGLGTGGGSLLLLWLTLVLGIDTAQARLINLMFFIPAAVIATAVRCFRGGIPYKKIWLPAVAGCASAVLFATWGSHMDMKLLQKGFGVLLLFTGVRELLYQETKA